MTSVTICRVTPLMYSTSGMRREFTGVAKAMSCVPPGYSPQQQTVPRRMQKVKVRPVNRLRVRRTDGRDQEQAESFAL